MTTDILLIGALPGVLFLAGFVLGRASARRSEETRAPSADATPFDAERYLRALPTETLARLDGELSAQGLIATIRLVREQSGLGLRDAKLAVEALARRRKAVLR